MPNKSRKVVSQPLRMDPELAEKLDYASDKLHMKKAEVMRLALEVGLEDLASLNYQLARTLATAAITARQPVDYRALEALPPSKVADGDHEGRSNGDSAAGK